MTNRFSYNSFARSPWYGCSPDLPATIAAVGLAGFDDIGIDMVSLGAWLKAGGTLAEVDGALRSARIGCQVLAACALLDGGNAALDALGHAASAAHLLGARFLQVNIAAPDAQARRDAVAAACRRIDGAGLVLALEYMPFSPLATLAETLDIVAAVGSDRAGALVDIWHHSHDPQGWDTLQSAPLDAIAYVEFDDALPPLGGDLLTETMDRRTFPGEGVLDTTLFARLLRQRGYTGMVSVEVLNREWLARPIDEFAARCLIASRRCWMASDPE